MNSNKAVEDFLHIVTSNSNYNIRASSYRMTNFSGVEIYLRWPSGAMLTFCISEKALLKDPESAFAPYLKKVRDYEMLLSSPLMKVLK
jgi:hypothetical protein